MKQLQAEKLMSIVGEYFPDLDPKICGMGLKSANYGVTVHTLSIRDRSEIDIHIVVPLSSAEKPFYVDQLNLFRDTFRGNITPKFNLFPSYAKPPVSLAAIVNDYKSAKIFVEYARTLYDNLTSVEQPPKGFAINNFRLELQKHLSISNIEKMVEQLSLSIGQRIPDVGIPIDKHQTFPIRNLDPVQQSILQEMGYIKLEKINGLDEKLPILTLKAVQLSNRLRKEGWYKEHFGEGF